MTNSKVMLREDRHSSLAEAGAGRWRIFRRSGKTLGNRRPGGGGFTNDSQFGVGNVPRLRHDLAELYRAPLDEVRFTGFGPFPYHAGWRREPDAGPARRHRQAPVRKGPAKRIYPDDGDVLDSIRVHASLAKQIVDRLTVRPGFDQASGNARANAHRGADPWNSLLWVGDEESIGRLRVEPV